MSLKIFVVVATVGRAAVTTRTVDRLSLQTRAPDGILVVGASDDDVEGVARASSRPEIVLAEKGLCKQRNKSLDLLKGRADIIVFFDDDYVAAPEFIAGVEELFGTRPDLVGATGRLIADGIHSDGFTVDEAIAMIEADDAGPPRETISEALYGCNMVIRLAAAKGLRFEEALPMYGWQEDIDFTYQLGKRGSMVKSSLLRGVHMGNKGARSPGKRLGYSQIANPVFLLKKGSIPPKLAWRLMSRNVLANIIGMLKRDPKVDRIGRVVGNLTALRDYAANKLDPRYILQI